MPKTAAERSQEFREELSAVLGEYLRDVPQSKHSVADFAAFIAAKE